MENAFSKVDKVNSACDKGEVEEVRREDEVSDKDENNGDEDEVFNHKNKVDNDYKDRDNDEEFEEYESIIKIKMSNNRMR